MTCAVARTTGSCPRRRFLPTDQPGLVRLVMVDYFRYSSCTIRGMTAAGQPDPRAYMRLAALIRDQIADGKLVPRGVLPSCAALRPEQGHSRQPAGKAMRVRADEGLIYAGPCLGGV